MREEVEGLEDHSHLGAQLSQGPALLRQRDSVNLDLPFLDRLEAVDGTAQGRLARSGGADDGDNLTTVDVEGDVVESLETAVVLGDVADPHQDVIVPVCGGLVRRGCGCGHEYLVSTWVWERHLSHRQQQQHIRMRTAFLLGLCRPTQVREFQPLVRKSSTVSNRSVNRLTTPPNLGRCSHAIQGA